MIVDVDVDLDVDDGLTSAQDVIVNELA